MLPRAAVFIFMLLFFSVILCAAEVKKDYPIRPVPFKDFEAAEGFWKTRIDTNRNVTIPYAFKMCEETGRIDNFAIAGGLKKGKLQGYYFNDSDVFKIIEGAAYSLAIYPDAELEKYIDGVIAKIAEAQEEDGYLYTARTIDPENPPEHSGRQRWSKLRYSHELYNVGHLYEAAAAWYEATGKRNLLDVAVNNADLVCRTFGPDRKQDTSGHEEIEVGLVRLYNVTGEKKYLEMAKFFIDQRGHHEVRESYKDFRQDHKPFIEQDEAVGHAVSGAYLYAGAADVAALTGDKEYLSALDRIWQDVVSKKLYITGVAAASGEKFGDPYKLPNLKGYNETCAAIALAMWNHRMFLLHGDAKYIDVLERSLYNGIISGVSLQGNSFFYSNPLSSDGVYKFTNKKLCTRASWFKCSCCPSNIARLISSVQGYVYAQKDDIIYVNLYSAGAGKIDLPDNTVLLKQETLYPWQGKVEITVSPSREGEFSIYLRLPGWATGKPVPSDLYRYALQLSPDISLIVNGEKVKLRKDRMPKDGYAKIKRVWNKGDVIELTLPMPVRRVICSEKVEENRGKVALQRGPIVYCAEWFDNNGKVSNITVSDDDEFEAVYQKNALGGLNTIKAKKAGFLAIPYYAWSHRGQGEMAVWLDRDKTKHEPAVGTDTTFHGMTATEPAGTWKQAFPTGNGSVGAMAYGDPHNEKILLNHEALFYPLWPKPAKVPDMAQHLPEVRRLIAEGKYKEAEDFWNEKLKEHKYGLEYAPFTNPYHPACDLVMRRQWEKPDNVSEIRDYKQRLDFEKAEVTAAWKQGDVEYERSMFVSRSDDVVVVRLAGSKAGSVTTNIALIPHNPQKDIYPVRMGRDKEYLLLHKPYKDEAIEYRQGPSGENLVLRGRYPDGREFGAVARIISKSGKVRLVDERLAITNADEVLVIVKLFANETDADAVIRKLSDKINELAADYEQLLQPHATEHRKLFSRMSLDLDTGSGRELSNKELLDQAKDGEMPAALAERLYEFGRYILICSSRPDGLPANLQGLWSGTWTPSWSCDYTLNENIQMAYWQALPGNTLEVTQAYFDYFDSLIPDWKTNARQFWGCRGIMGYMRSSDHGLISQCAPWQFWTGTAGWLSQLYYDYYLYTGDKDFLEKRAVPLMKEAALFYEDFLFEGPHGKMVFSPSVSPENRPGNSRYLTTVNATMDVAIAKDMLTNLISACKTLDIEQQGIRRWQNILAKMPEYEIAPDGALKEWLHPDLKNNDGHRHVSHMYPLFPGFEVDSDEGDAAIRQACKKVLDTKHQAENRKVSSGRAVFGWSYGHLANCFARLGRGREVLDCLRGIAITCSEWNLLSLFDPPDGPFQIDGNCGFSSAVLEMLLYSRPGVIKLLPAIPKDWSKGKAKGMLARGGIEVSIEWDTRMGKIAAVLKSRTQQNIKLRFPPAVKQVTSNDAQEGLKLEKASEDSQYWNVTLPEGKEVRFQATIKKAGQYVLKADAFRHHVDYFNEMEPEIIINYIPNAESWDWIKANAPLFECPDKKLEQIYYYRWWTFRKHIKKTEDGFVLTEFHDNVGHSGKHNTISCALGHHIYEGRWLHDGRYMDEYSAFWYRGDKGGLQPHLRRYSNWTADALYNRYLVNKDRQFIVGLLDGMIADFEGWEKERGLDNGMFWQYDVLDGMEESISGGRKKQNTRPTINSYMYANAVAISKIAEMADKVEIAMQFSQKAAELKKLIQEKLWDEQAKFFKVRFESGALPDVREELGLIPWYFNLPDAGYEEAWLQILDPQGFKAPMGLMTAERRHPAFRSHGVGTCEWDGAVWPYASTQTLVGLANLLRNYKQNYVTKDDYFEALLAYARSHNYKDRPYIGEYLDENTGQWLTPDSDRSRYYNHSGFCDLIINGLAGLRPRTGEMVEVDPLVPDDTWNWFCLDNVLYHGQIITVIWDKDGQKYNKGKGLRVYADGKEIGHLEKIGRITAELP